MYWQTSRYVRKTWSACWARNMVNECWGLVGMSVGGSVKMSGRVKEKVQKENERREQRQA